MSFTVARDGSLIVLDQVNARLVRFGRDGKPTDVPLTQRAPQDIAAAADGTLAVLDRLGDKDVALLDPDGTSRGQLPLTAPNLGEPGGVTGVFIDGNQVYAEREHGQLVHLGDTSGNAASDGAELQGRPTRDGRFTLLAGIVQGRGGRLYLAVGDRNPPKNRYTHELDLPRPALAIELLDSDLRGTIYLAALEGDDGAPPALMLLCAEESTGELLGEVPLPVNPDADETTRELAALGTGGVLYAQRSDEGMSFRIVSCP